MVAAAAAAVAAGGEVGAAAAEEEVAETALRLAHLVLPLPTLPNPTPLNPLDKAAGDPGSGPALQRDGRRTLSSVTRARIGDAKSYTSDSRWGGVSREEGSGIVEVGWEGLAEGEGLAGLEEARLSRGSVVGGGSGAGTTTRGTGE